MPLRRNMKGLPSDRLAAVGFLQQDWTAMTPAQRECTVRLGMNIQLEQEAYLTQHPEVKAMLEIFISKITQHAKRKEILKEAGLHFTRSADVLIEEIKERIGVPSYSPYVKRDKPPFTFKDIDIENSIKQIVTEHFPPEPWRVTTPVIPTPDTLSSSFLSIMTSVTTLPTPESIPTPEPTVSETFFCIISNTVDKAIYSHVDDGALKYNTAYVELLKAVEEAMEIPVIEIRKDIADLLYNSYKMYEIDIMEKERIAAQIAWEKRMRKKTKRTLRRLHDFKGWETPPTPKSVVSSHESLPPPPKPCVCHPQFTYNRYPKDRFGIYLPRDAKYSKNNVTVTPAISMENLTDDQVDDKTTDTKSEASKKSTPGRSGVSKKTTNFEN